MPVDAKPEPWPEPLVGLVHHRREYRDLLGRPMRGEVTITGGTRIASGETVVVPTRVVVKLVEGVLDVDLPPDTYTVTAALRSADGDRAADTTEVTLTAG